MHAMHMRMRSTWQNTANSVKISYSTIVKHNMLHNTSNKTAYRDPLYKCIASWEIIGRYHRVPSNGSVTSIYHKNPLVIKGPDIYEEGEFDY